MTEIHTATLANTLGGVQRGQSPAQLRERYQNICLAPDPQTARRQHDSMLMQMVPDSSEAPGIQRRPCSRSPSSVTGRFQAGSRPTWSNVLHPGRG